MDRESSNRPAPRFVVRPPQKNGGRTVIPVAAPEQSGQLLIGPDGGAVWPISSMDEAMALERVAGVFGGKTVAVEARPSSQAASGQELVAGCNDSDIEVSLFAHLTG